MSAVLKEIGFADAVLAREDEKGRLILIDGHMRAGIDPNAEVPVLVLDVDEKEAEKILATADPIAAMAETDWDALTKLTKSIKVDTDEFGAVLEDIMFDDALGLAPESVQKNVDDLNKIKAQRKKGNEGIISKTDTEKYLVIVFKSRKEREDALRKMGLPYDERYIAADTVEITVSKRKQFRGAGRPLQAAAANRAGTQG